MRTRSASSSSAPARAASSSSAPAKPAGKTASKALRAPLKAVNSSRPGKRLLAAARPPKKPNSRFAPLPLDGRKKPKVPVVAQPKVPRGASILLVQEPWLGLILSGLKTLEIRGKPCRKPAGEKIFLALAGGGGVVLGAAKFEECVGPFGAADWSACAQQHCVAGAKLPYGGSTYGWRLSSPERFAAGVPYEHKQGCVVWAMA